MQGIHWINRVCNSYSTPARLAAGAAGALAIGLIARQALKSREGKKSDENELVGDVERISDCRYRVSKKITVISNEAKLAEWTANAVESAKFNLSGLDKLNIYVVFLSSWKCVFVNGFFEKPQSFQKKKEDTFVVFFPGEKWSEKLLMNYKKFLFDGDKVLIALGEDHVFFDTYENYLKI